MERTIRVKKINTDNRCFRLMVNLHRRFRQKKRLNYSENGIVDQRREHFRPFLLAPSTFGSAVRAFSPLIARATARILPWPEPDLGVLGDRKSVV